MSPSIKHTVNLVLLFHIVIYTSCNNSIQPDEEFGSCHEPGPGEKFRLSITDGYYQIISGTEERTAISFNYCAQGAECNVGGYHIQWGEGVSMVDWYLMKSLIPGQEYSINVTINHPVSNPVVSMQGYLIGSSDADPRLRAEYCLQKKSSVDRSASQISPP